MPKNKLKAVKYVLQCHPSMKNAPVVEKNESEILIENVVQKLWILVRNIRKPALHTASLKCASIAEIGIAGKYVWSEIRNLAPSKTYISTQLVRFHQFRPCSTSWNNNNERYLYISEEIVKMTDLVSTGSFLTASWLLKCEWRNGQTQFWILSL